ncbi:MAG TPA: hypothetical protein GX691_01305 [Clostridia bacterium]|nr:hypothetical protein [Clostridia bacterium]
MKKSWTYLGLLFLVLVIAAFPFSGKAEDSASLNTEPLPVVGSLEKLESLLSRMEGENQRLIFRTGETADSIIPSAGASPQQGDKAASQASKEYSGTNVQVEGVDEGDIVKTDGEYIYQVCSNRLVISRAYPAREMKVHKVISFSENCTPSELYVDDAFLVVIASVSGRTYDYAPTRPGSEIYPPPARYQPFVKVIVYDITDKNSIKNVRELELDGNYLSSRKVGSFLYLAANKHIDRYYIMEGSRPDLPGYRDSASGGDYTEIGLDKIRYFPDCSTPSYLLIAGLDLNQPAKNADVSSYLGSGEEIYVSRSALYTAITRYQRPSPLLKGGKGAILPAEANTSIYKFALSEGNVSYKAAGKVPGRILNQFSMDAYKGYFRAATTTGDIWRQDEGTSKNNIYVLDGGMNIIGQLENIAPGERIYSARFVGDRAYLVTFKKVDPFFVIDMSSPRTPRVLGALKIPGYSDYLHPVDNNHVLGFGKDTVEEKWTDWNGNEGSTAYYRGMKIALFDVSDVTRPVEKFKTVIGDRGTDSPLLHDHKALLFDKDKGLMAFPVTVMEVKGDKAGATAYGEFVFQGAYVYSFSIEKGFTLRGKITHLSGEDLLKSGHSWYHSDKNVERVLYIGDILYTTSGRMIKAHDLQTMVEVNQLVLNR